MYIKDSKKIDSIHQSDLNSSHWTFSKTETVPC